MADNIRIKWRSREVQRKVDSAVEKGLDRLAIQVMTTAKESMSTPKHGKDYRQTAGGKPLAPGKRKKFGYWRNRSSAPYEPPAVQQGALQKSIHWKRTKKLERWVGTNISQAPYGLYLEVGTRNMIERPYLRPALYKHTGRTGEELFEALLK